MINFTYIEANGIRKFISKVLGDKKPVFSNFFIANNLATYSIANTDSTVVIRLLEDDFYRLYIVTLDENDAVNLLLSLNQDIYVLNVPTKGNVSQWEKFMSKAGFELIGHYKRLYNIKIKTRKSAVNTFAKIEDLDSISKLLLSNFSPYVDYIPRSDQLSEMIKNHQIIADYDAEGNICGVLIYTIEGKKCYLNAWIDHGKNGLFLLYKAYNIAAENNIPYIYFWVNADNSNVLKLHELMGAKYDGLNDYTFKNKKYERKNH